MTILFNFVFFVTICRIKCQQVMYEDLKVSEQKPDEKIDFSRATIERRFLEDLDDYEWHVAHLRGAAFDGRRDCMGDTFADKVRRYRRMLRDDASRVEFVSADPISVDPSEIVEDTCRVDENNVLDSNEYGQVTLNLGNLTQDSFNVEATTVASNVTAEFNTTESMKLETTAKLDFKATTATSAKSFRKKKPGTNNTQENMRRASEYMFSSVEYYDESVDFDETVCPDFVDIIELEIDLLRNYDLECELTLEWRSLE